MKHLYSIPMLFLLFNSIQVNSQGFKDSTTILSAFKQGKTSGHFRLYYMSTNNEHSLTDYYALAFGGGLKYVTKNFKGFQLGIGGFFLWNISSSDLTKPDSLTSIMNRYEIGQFDQTDPSNKKNLQRLEDFYIKYNFKTSFIKYGKQVIKTPFINPQDGRMRPTGEQGLWAEINEVKKIKVELGWITHISPRGTLKWYSGASSIGIYPAGVTINGSKSAYTNNLESKGIAVAGISYLPNKQIKLQVWDHWVENIFNTILVQANADIKIGNDKKIVAAFQYIHQHAINDGGNTDPFKTFFNPSQQVNIFGVSIGYITEKSFTKLNYSHITDDGRFLFPREWGREPLFTFSPRERNEGLGGVHAITMNAGRYYFNKKMKFETGIGYYDLPDVKNYRLNKYGLPSYYQLNFNATYTFDKLLNGLNLELLYLYKGRIGDSYRDRKYVINKTNMHQLNMILNYNF
jgi:hypothetical protein